jgi:hypothetical protein
MTSNRCKQEAEAVDFRDVERRFDIAAPRLVSGACNGLPNIPKLSNFPPPVCINGVWVSTLPHT